MGSGSCSGQHFGVTDWCGGTGPAVDITISGMDGFGGLGIFKRMAWCGGLGIVGEWISVVAVRVPQWIVFSGDWMGLVVQVLAVVNILEGMSCIRDLEDLLKVTQQYTISHASYTKSVCFSETTHRSVPQNNHT